MEKQTKNIITRESIEKKLCDDNRASLKVSALAFFAAALVGILWVVFFIPSFFEAPNFGFGVLFFFFATVGTVPAWVLLPNFVKDLKEYQHLKNGDLEIVIRPLLYKSEKEVRTHSRTRRWRTQGIFHFEGFDEFWVSPGMYQHCTWGDEFCIVHYKGTSKIKLAYPLKLYEYKEDEEESK